MGGINTYTYVENNPLNYTDPYGLSPLGWAVGVGTTAYVAYKANQLNNNYKKDRDIQDKWKEIIEKDMKGEPLPADMDVDKLKTDQYNNYVDGFENAKDLKSTIDNANKFKNLWENFKKSCTN